MNQTTKPRVIVITGAAAGVGRATARMFAESEGAHIGLLAPGLEGARRRAARGRGARRRA